MRIMRSAPSARSVSLLRSISAGCFTRRLTPISVIVARIVVLGLAAGVASTPLNCVPSREARRVSELNYAGYFAHGPYRYRLIVDLYTVPPEPPAPPKPKRTWATVMG